MCIALVLSSPVLSASSNNAEGQLTGGSSREWVFRGTNSFMGSACTKDQEVDAFASDHTLIVTSCVDGKTSKTSHVWHLYAENQLDEVIFIDGDAYLLLFHQDGHQQWMRLRKRSTSKADPTLDRDFRLSED